MPGKDFSKSFSPVATDTTICMIIGIFLYQLNHKNEDWVLEMFNVEAAFSKCRIGKAIVCGMARRNHGVGHPNPKGTQTVLYPALDTAMYGSVEVPLKWIVRTFSNTRKRMD
jgi:hypothetical protein